MAKETEYIKAEEIPGGAYGETWRQAHALAGHWTKTQADGFQYLWTWSTGSWYRRQDPAALGHGVTIPDDQSFPGGNFLRCEFLNHAYAAEKIGIPCSCGRRS